MKRFAGVVLLLALVLCPARAAVITLQHLEPTQFQTNLPIVKYLAVWTNELGQIHPAQVNDGVTVTNFTHYGALVLPDKVTLLTVGTNVLNMATNSAWLLYSPTNDAAQVVLSLTAGAFQGQLAFIQSQNSDGAFTLPDLSEQDDVPGAFVDISGDWIATTNRGILLRYAAPDWVEASRADPSSTNGPFGSGISGMVDGFYPFGTNSTDLVPGLLFSGNPQTVELRSAANNTSFITLNPLNTNVSTGTFEVRQRDSSGEQSAMWLNGGKSGGWDLGTPGTRDGFFSVNVLNNNSMAQRFNIDGSSGLVSFLAADGLSTIATIGNASGYTGTGTNLLSDDGTYKAASGSALWSESGGTISPSPAANVSTGTGTLSIGSLTNTFIASGANVTYSNANVLGAFLQIATPGSSKLAGFGNNGSGDAMVRAGTGQAIFLQPNLGSVSYAATTLAFQPNAAGLDLGTSASASQWRDVFLTRNLVWNGTTNSLFDTWGAGTPQGVTTAGPGSVFRDTLNGDLYKKSTGTGNTGWEELAGTFSATATLNFGSILAAASEDLTITVTGAAVGDSVTLGLPAAPDATTTFNGFVSAANTITVRCFNVGTIAVDPASATYRATVNHY